MDLKFMIPLIAGALVGSAAQAGAAEPARPPFAAFDHLPALAEPPDVLTMLDGTRVATADDWRNKRRPELISLFQWYMYGAPPAAAATAKITFEVERETDVLDGLATMKQVTLYFGPPGKEQDGTVHLLLFVPKERQGPVPVVLGLNFQGNHAVFDHKDIALTKSWMPAKFAGVKDERATEASRGSESSRWPIERAIRRGYAVATFYHGDVQSDRPKWDGAPALYFRAGQIEPDDHEWGTIAAWAWGLSRAADYLTQDPAIDGGRMIVVGHSRNGKTALLAGALDERFAIVIPSQAGCGGTSPARGTVGESVKRINTAFPYWFDRAFHKFNEEPQKLPFDQHCLMALVAPRPLLLTNATGDQWANPSGQFEMARLADPVYRLLGVEGCSAQAMPPENELVNSRLGYFIRPGKHDMSVVEWDTWLDFSDKHLPRKGGRPGAKLWAPSQGRL